MVLYVIWIAGCVWNWICIRGLYFHFSESIIFLIDWLIDWFDCFCWCRRLWWSARARTFTDSAPPTPFGCCRRSTRSGAWPSSSWSIRSFRSPSSSPFSPIAYSWLCRPRPSSNPASKSSFLPTPAISPFLWYTHTHRQTHTHTYIDTHLSSINLHLLYRAHNGAKSPISYSASQFSSRFHLKPISFWWYVKNISWGWMDQLVNWCDWDEWLLQYRR